LFVEGSTEIEETDIFDTSKIVEKYWAYCEIVAYETNKRWIRLGNCSRTRSISIVLEYIRFKVSNVWKIRENTTIFSIRYNKFDLN
jgi:hypothetical protein